MASCPEGLTEGFGVAAPAHHALCLTVSSFLKDGREAIRPGTGMLFYNSVGSSYIITAAHNIYAPQERVEMLGATVYFGRYGESWAYQRKVQNWFYPEEFAASGNADPRWDFGVMRVNLLEAQAVVPIPLYKSAAPAAPDVLVSGYPNEDQCFNTQVPWYCTPSLHAVDDSTFGYANQPTYAGMSGAPLLRRRPDGRLVSYGIHIRGAEQNPGGARAVRFSDRVATRIFSWLGITL